MNNLDKKQSSPRDSQTMKRLLAYARPYWYLFLISLILLLSLTVLELLNPYILKLAIDDYITVNNRPVYRLETREENSFTIDGEIYISRRDYKKQGLGSGEELRLKKEGDNFYIADREGQLRAQLSQEDYTRLRELDMEGISQISILFFFIVLFAFIFEYIQTYILNYTGQKIIFNIRNEVFNHIQNLSLGFFDTTAIGRLVTRVNNDTETLNEMFTSVLINLFKDLFTLVGIIVIMIRMDYRLALFSMAFVPIFLIISIFFRGKIREAYSNYRKQLSLVNTSLNENITGMTTIKIFNKEEKINRAFDSINRDYLDASYREVQVHAMLRPTIEFVRSFGIAILVYLGGGRVVSGLMEFGTLYIFIDYMQRFFQPIFELTEKYNIIQSAMTSSERIFAILDNEEAIENTSRPRDLEDIQGRIEFKNVWFAYEEDNWILRDISFTINPGESVAFVGPTGAGKTSIINLMTRFYDIQKGQILIDGIDIREIDKFQLRRKIGVVLQDVFLFAGSIEDNIRLRTPGISRDKVVEVAEYVNADRFIEKLPKKYDEPVMERGATLSAGERQLLSFARTLAHDPRILILDEATANIDTETELLIQEAISRVVHNRTSVAIAHRLSTIQHADKIIVLKQGEIAEMGSHQELLEKRGTYYELYRLQYKE